MREINELKALLISIRSNKWSIPKEVDNYELALQALDNIGSTDPELRDKLILNLLEKMIVEKVLTDTEVKRILELALSENHLFYNIGKEDDDSVFNRAFSILIVESILRRHNQNQDKLFAEDEIIRIYKEVIRYLKEERDLRGYVGGRGWADSVSHTSDAIAELALCKEIKEPQLIEILEEIKKKTCINYYVYINNEEERLVTAVINVIERKVIRQEKIICWIKSFEDRVEKIGYPEYHNLISNHKGVLSALYFRLKRMDGTQGFLGTIEEVINNTKYMYL